MTPVEPQVYDILRSHGFTDVRDLSKLSGGDINAAFHFRSVGQDYFIKVNSSAPHPDLFEREANGLDELKKHTEFHIPEVVGTGKDGEHQFLILEFLHPGRAGTTSWRDFAERLAKMHRYSNTKFGFFENNYLGTQPQDNREKESWAEFYAENRLLPSIRQMYDKKIGSRAVVRQTEQLCKKLTEIYPEELPALVHGDLWSGNYHVMQSGEITLIDPAVYYGHREMDLGMARLFGGFPDVFYDVYARYYPLESGLEERLQISQLYPLIFHAIRFKGSYIGAVERILAKFG